MGFLSFGGTIARLDERRRLLEHMGRAIAHRGPDETTYYDDGTLALVFTRLSIVDVAHGSQPFRDPQGDRLLVANAEIYNHGPLRRELTARHRFATASDCEVPLHALAEWGTGAFERLNGMFALAHWDRRARVLTLARDRLGIKPLYVCRLADGLLFGSELKGLLAHTQCPRELDWRVLDCGSMGRTPRDTYVHGVEFLPGGDFLTASADGVVSQHTYWSLDRHLATAPFGNDARAYTDAYASLLETVTNEHLQREVGAGLHLSGGLDSSLLAALVSRREGHFPCFSLVERTSVLGGDVAAARALTQKLGLPWHPVLVDYRTVVDELRFDLRRFEESVWMMDSPRFDLEWILKMELHRVAQATVPDLKVVLLGQGADEFAGGYSNRQDAPREGWQDYIDDEVVPNLLFHEEIERSGAGTYWPWLADRPKLAGGHGAYHRMMRLLSRQLQQHNLWHEDRSSSWHGLEARVPFLDHRLVELLASVPEPLHATLFWDKAIVRQAMHRAMPDWNLPQRKMGFLGAADQGSLDAILHTIVKRISGPFLESYGRSSNLPFDAAKLADLRRRTLQRGPQFRENAQRLLECMAIAVFERQCHSGCTAASDEQPTLPVLEPEAWSGIERLFAGPLARVERWTSTEVVRLRDGAQVLLPIAAGDKQQFVFLVDGQMAGQLAAPPGHPWLARLLEQLGQGASHSVGDWAARLMISEAELTPVLGLLAQRGMLAEAVAASPPTFTPRATIDRSAAIWH